MDARLHGLNLLSSRTPLNSAGLQYILPNEVLWQLSVTELEGWADVRRLVDAWKSSNHNGNAGEVFESSKISRKVRTPNRASQSQRGFVSSKFVL